MPPRKGGAANTEKLVRQKKKEIAKNEVSIKHLISQNLGVYKHLVKQVKIEKVKQIEEEEKLQGENLVDENLSSESSMGPDVDVDEGEEDEK